MTDPRDADLRAITLEWAIRVHEHDLRGMSEAVEQAIVQTAREFEKYLLEG